MAGLEREPVAQPGRRGGGARGRAFGDRRAEPGEERIEPLPGPDREGDRVRARDPPGRRRGPEVGEVGLVEDEQRVAVDQRGQRGVRFRRARVQHHQPEIGVLRAVERAADPLRLDRARFVAQPRRVGHDRRIAAEVEMDLDRVPRGAGLGRDDGDVAPGERVDQARLAHVGRAEHGDRDPVPEPLAAPRVREMARDLAGERGDGAGDLRLGLRRQVLVGEVDHRLEMGERADQVPAPPVIERRQRAARLAHRLAALGLGLGVDQVGDRLDLREVELAGEEGAAGEVARPGGGEARDAPEREPDRLDRRPPAMEVELDEVLAGIARRRREAEREPVVEDLAGPGVAEFHAHRPPRRRRGEPGQAFERGGGARPGDPEHRDGAPSRRGRQREDGGMVGEGHRP